ncbi:COG4705 family protein [Jatrophihabitans sp. YIM 134969]
MRSDVRVPEARYAPVASKVPQITAVFWVVKVLTTGMGEATSDYLGGIDLVLAGGVGVIGFAVALWWQFRTDRYRPVVYWFAVAMVAVFGTMVADVVHVAGVPYAVTTPFYAVVLAVVFTLWWRSEGTLSIHSITTRRREVWYWLTVLVTFALGTAAGDLTATSLHLGFFWSGVLFAAAMLVPLVGFRLGVNEVVTFWTAYVITRPLGASFADWFGKEHSIGGGLGYGDGPVAGVMLLAIVVLVGYLAVQDRSSRAAESPAR